MSKSIEKIVTLNKLSGRGYDELGNVRSFTDKEFFDISCEMALNQTNPDYCRLFKGLADWVKNALRVSTALEIGSGPGYLLNCLNKLNIDCAGIDGNPFSKAFFDENHPEFAEKYFIDKFFEKDYAPVDTLLSIEVFEHIPDEGLINILTKVKNELKPKFIVFSSTPFADPNPGWDLQWGHINLKTPAEWQELFNSFGYRLHAAKPPVTEWASLYADQTILN